MIPAPPLYAVILLFHLVLHLPPLPQLGLRCYLVPVDVLPIHSTVYNLPSILLESSFCEYIRHTAENVGVPFGHRFQVGKVTAEQFRQ